MQEPLPTNPFAYRRKRSPWRSIGWVLFGFSVVAASVMAPKFVDRFLLMQLTQDLETLPSEAKLDRLNSIGQLGLEGVPILVKAISNDDPSIARSASEILKRMQDDSMQKSAVDGVAVHGSIADQLSIALNTIPVNRYPWLRELLQRTLLDTLSIDTDQARDSYRAATTLLSRIALDPERVSKPVSLVAESSLDTMGPSTPQESIGMPQKLEPMKQPSLVLQPTQMESETEESPTEEDRWIDPSLQPRAMAFADRAPLEAKMMVDDNIQESSIPSEAFALPIGGEANILSAGSNVTIHPLEAYSTRAVIDLLGSIREPLSDAARSELIRRGFGTADLQLAIRLASTNASIRLGLIDEVPQRSDIDPRQWLLWLAEDGERSIRLRALAALGTMDDPNIAKQLRALLINEQDPSVAARIRQALVR